MKICALALLLKNIVSCQISCEVKTALQNDGRNDCAVLEDLMLHAHHADYTLASWEDGERVDLGGK